MSRYGDYRLGTRPQSANITLSVSFGISINSSLFGIEASIPFSLYSAKVLSVAPFVDVFYTSAVPLFHIKKNNFAKGIVDL